MTNTERTLHPAISATSLMPSPCGTSYQSAQGLGMRLLCNQTTITLSFP